MEAKAFSNKRKLNSYMVNYQTTQGPKPSQKIEKLNRLFLKFPGKITEK